MESMQRSSSISFEWIRCMWLLAFGVWLRPTAPAAATCQAGANRRAVWHVHVDVVMHVPAPAPVYVNVNVNARSH